MSQTAAVTPVSPTREAMKGVMEALDRCLLGDASEDDLSQLRRSVAALDTVCSSVENRAFWCKKKIAYRVLHGGREVPKAAWVLYDALGYDAVRLALSNLMHRYVTRRDTFMGGLRVIEARQLAATA